MTLHLIVFYLITSRMTFAAKTNRHCFPPRPKEPRGELELWDYGPNMFCSALLTAPNSYGIYMYFLECDLEHWSGVLYDYVVMFEGTDCLAPRFAVTSGERIFSSSKTNISLLFISDKTIQGSGFRLLYQPEINKDDWKWSWVEYSARDRILHNCGTELNTTTPKTISWEGKDQYNTLCIWRIKAKQGHTISLSITKLKLKLEGSFVRVLDGADCGAEVLQLFQRNKNIQSQDLHSTSNAMVIVLGVPAEKGDRFIASFAFSDSKALASETTTVKVKMTN